MDCYCCISGAYCDRSFKTTIQLTNHVNTHLGVKPFQVDPNYKKFEFELFSSKF